MKTFTMKYYLGLNIAVFEKLGIIMLQVSHIQRRNQVDSCVFICFFVIYIQATH